MAKSVWIVACCYDGSLHGWAYENGNFHLKFAYAAHQSCIKCVAINPSTNTLVTGSVDETLKEKVTLNAHEDTVNTLKFVGDSYLLSGSRNGNTFLWRVGDWKRVHTFKGHKEGPCVSIAVHPNQNLFFSSSRDNSLRLWDLKTRSAASRMKIEGTKEIYNVCWSTCGTKYGVLCDLDEILIYDALSTDETPSVRFKLSSKVNSVCFFEHKNDTLLMSLNSGSIIIYDIQNKCIKQEIKCDEILETKLRVRFSTALQNKIYAAVSTNQILVFEENDSNLFELKDTINVAAKGHITCFEVYFKTQK